ncbi:AraC family transcriptional regulator [Oleiphilus messinensis]|uniref:AraC family transcriptional regulator n=1 Tax=Oleiphilus messinensis TaxID=141451 RepID=A0A1Y0ID11_9GAMM|nr:AraC family transcriptional regulator [Oleiphilus messinensis]ARU58418.1 AraC family transcriptional regulator [Oleiphilus messinensis]
MTTFEDQAIFPSAELFLIRRFMKSEGIKTKQWLLGTGLQEGDLLQVDTLVSLHQFDMIYRNLYRLAQRPDLGLALGKALNLSRWGVLAGALISSKTLGDALETANRYRTLLRSRFVLNPVMINGRCEIQITKRQEMEYPLNSRFAHEVLLGTLTSQVQDIIAQPFHFDEIRLAYPAPKHARQYQQHLGCAVQFDCDQTMLAIRLETMTRPLPMGNLVAKQQALKLCEQEVARVGQVQKGDMCWQVRAALAVHRDGLPKLDDVAVQLKVTPRTLRRKLQVAGTSFRQISQEHQLQQALDQLAIPSMKVSSVAASCGFSDLASFRESFKRQTGFTPQAYRKTLFKMVDIPVGNLTSTVNIK